MNKELSSKKHIKSYFLSVLPQFRMAVTLACRRAFLWKHPIDCGQKMLLLSSMWLYSDTLMKIVQNLTKGNDIRKLGFFEFCFYGQFIDTVSPKKKFCKDCDDFALTSNKFWMSSLQSSVLAVHWLGWIAGLGFKHSFSSSKVWRQKKSTVCAWAHCKVSNVNYEHGRRKQKVDFQYLHKP